MDEQTENLSDRVFARIKPTVSRQLDAAAEEDNREKSEVVRIAIEEYLKRRQAAKVLDPAREALMAGAR